MVVVIFMNAAIASVAMTTLPIIMAVMIVAMMIVALIMASPTEVVTVVGMEAAVD